MTTGENDKSKSKDSGWLTRLAKYVGILVVILGSVAAAGNKIVEIEKLAPDFYYGYADDHCADKTGYGVALRSANLSMIRCYTEKQGLSAARELSKDDIHAGLYPLALVAEACNYKAVRYLVLLRGADPRYGHIYFDPNRPKGISNDTPKDIALSHCREPGTAQRPGDLTPQGQEIVAFLDEQVAKISPLGR